MRLLNNSNNLDGGAIGIKADTGFNDIVDCNQFTGNFSNGAGGAISHEGNSQLFLKGNQISDNTSADGGAVFIGPMELNNFLLEGPVNPVVVTDCTIENNSGGGVLIDGRETVFQNCVIRKNVTNANGAGLDVRTGSEVLMVNCIIDGNEAAGFGGAVLNLDAAFEMIHCTIVHNSAEAGADSIAATSNANTNIGNSIIWDNGSPMAATEGGTGFFVSFSVVEGGFPGAGNISVDPLFVDPLGPDGMVATGDEDFSLQAGSPAIDAASNLLVPTDMFDVDEDLDVGEQFPIDLLGENRFQDAPATDDSGFGPAPVVDMGAIEFQVGSKILLGDVNLDGVVNLLDVAPFIDRIALGVFQGEADTNEDGVVNLLDVEPFIAILAGN